MKPSPPLTVADGAVQPSLTDGQHPPRADDAPHVAEQGFRAFDRLPALLTPRQFRALLQKGRSWFWEHERAGSFREFEVSVAGERYYSGRLIAERLKLADVDPGQLQQPLKVAQSVVRSFRAPRHVRQRRTNAGSGPREVGSETSGER